MSMSSPGKEQSVLTRAVVSIFNMGIMQVLTKVGNCSGAFPCRNFQTSSTGVPKHHTDWLHKSLPSLYLDSRLHSVLQHLRSSNWS